MSIRQVGYSVFDSYPVHVAPPFHRTFSSAPYQSRIVPMNASAMKQVDLAESRTKPNSPDLQRIMVHNTKTGQKQPLRTHRTGVSPRSPPRNLSEDEDQVVSTRSLRSSLQATRRPPTADPFNVKGSAKPSTGRTQTDAQAKDIPKLDFTAIRPFNTRYFSRSAREVPVTESPNRMGSSSNRWKKLDWAWSAPERERREQGVPVNCTSTVVTSPSTLEFRFSLALFDLHPARLLTPCNHVPVARFDSMYGTGRREGWAIRKERSTGRWHGVKDEDTEAGRYGQWTAGVEVTRPFTAGVRNNAWNYHWQTAQDWSTAKQWQETRREGSVAPSRAR